ncbi:3-oxoacyl-ACP synthase [Hylemonella gracilis]|uniref:3-oxoacyl-ACP synthase n=1 Tax=Hylemonella gracilis TaxID=80880 RepID=A0A4P6UJP0_9BURK|nr:beta-ketoacyl synthase chain length factor [Hylemonella gracilis]QBK05263.1 3-oxoacyl-ACP synthase [Hylemonella gracilis]
MRPFHLHFHLNAWAACAPGLHQTQDWQAWARQPRLPLRQGLDSDLPALPEMAAMARRRLSPLGRMAVQAAWWCERGANGSAAQPSSDPQASEMPPVPVIFASGYGDAQRTLELQDSLAAGQAMSPTAFGLSVHNAIGAQYSIARGDHANYLAVAAGPCSAAAGLVEAASLLADGAPEVMLVCHEEGVPPPYDRYTDPVESPTPAMAWAWAWRLTTAHDANPDCFRLSLLDTEAGDHAGAPELPFGLDLLRFVLLTLDNSDTRLDDGLPWRRREGGQLWQMEHLRPAFAAAGVAL